MGIFKRLLLGGWVLLLLNGFLVVIFPNAAWNRSASWVLFALSIVLFVLTLGFCVAIVIRLISRLGNRITRSNSGGPQGVTLRSERRPQRNWRMLALLAILGIGVFTAALLAFIEHQIEASPVYQASVAKARKSPHVINSLGEPISEGWFSSGELTQSSDGSGHAALMIPLSGPRGNGHLQVEATRKNGSWRLLTLQFTASHQAASDLRGDDQHD